jgi:hypothetical protein
MGSNVVPGAAYVAPVQVAVASSYGMWVGGGNRFTRLIPADRIQDMSPEELQEASGWTGPEGMIILPPPIGHLNTNQLIPVEV